MSVQRGVLTRSDIQAPAEVSSVDINSKLLVLGTWTNEILVYSNDALKAGNSQPLVIKEKGFAVSLLLTQGRSTARLLAGLSDGSLLTIDLALEPLSLIGRKISKLGSRPLRLERIVDWQGDEQVVAIALSERMSVIFQTKDRIDFSSVSRRVSATEVHADDRTCKRPHVCRSTASKPFYSPHRPA